MWLFLHRYWDRLLIPALLLLAVILIANMAATGGEFDEDAFWIGYFLGRGIR